MARMRDSEAKVLISVELSVTETGYRPWIECRGQFSTDFPDGAGPPDASNSAARSDSVDRVGLHVPQPEATQRSRISKESQSGCAEK